MGLWYMNILLLSSNKAPWEDLITWINSVNHNNVFLILKPDIFYKVNTATSHGKWFSNDIKSDFSYQSSPKSIYRLFRIQDYSYSPVHIPVIPLSHFFYGWCWYVFHGGRFRWYDQGISTLYSYVIPDDRRLQEIWCSSQNHRA